MAINISVLLPVKNGEATILASVKSTLYAMSQASELLIFNDGSKDSTVDLINSISDNRIKIFENPKISGVAQALNFLLQKSAYSFVARIDADDISLPWRFKFFEQIESPPDFFFTSAIKFSKYRFFLHKQSFGSINANSFSRKLVQSNPVVHSTLIARKEKIIELGGYRSVAAEDYDLWFRASNKGYTLSKSSVPTVMYRIHQNQLTRKKSWIELDKSENIIYQFHKKGIIQDS